KQPNRPFSLARPLLPPLSPRGHACSSTSPTYTSRPCSSLSLLLLLRWPLRRPLQPARRGGADYGWISGVNRLESKGDGAASIPAMESVAEPLLLRRRSSSRVAGFHREGGRRGPLQARRRPWGRGGRLPQGGEGSAARNELTGVRRGGEGGPKGGAARCELAGVRKGRVRAGLRAARPSASSPASVGKVSSATSVGEGRTTARGPRRPWGRGGRCEAAGADSGGRLAATGAQRRGRAEGRRTGEIWTTKQELLQYALRGQCNQTKSPAL
ncbi:hypothetical protein BS78_01G366800, partial [Paspalum vaginatum]